MATPAQIAHLKQHQAAFERHTGYKSVERYFADFDQPDLYERVCADLSLTPLPAEATKEAPVATESDITGIQAVVQAELAKVLSQFGEQAEAATSPRPERPKSFDEVLEDVDPADSDAALAMLDFLLKTGRLGRVGVLDNGQGYLFMYQEPKGSTRQGYAPGATQGDRIVDQAVENQRAAGTTAAKRGMCPHCFSVVRQEGADLLLDDNDAITKGVAHECPNSPDGKHGMA